MFFARAEFNRCASMPAKEDLMSRTTVRFTLCLTLIGYAGAAVPASAQHFKRMKGSLTQIAAGRSEVWGLNGSKVYRFNSTTQEFAAVSGAPQGLTQIAVGGGTLLQKDEVWGVDVNGVGGGPVYHFNFSTNKFDEYDNGEFGLSQIVVGPGYEDKCHPYEVWGIVVSSVFPQGTWRYNYCISGFDNIPDPVNLKGLPWVFSQIAVGGGDVWGVSQSNPNNTGPGDTWERAGSEWVDGPGPNNFVPYPPYFQMLSVGVNDVWALDSTGAVWNWAPASGNFDKSVSQTGTATQIATGGDGVWLIYGSSDGQPGLIARYDFQSTGVSTYTLDSPALQIAVGSGAGVWAIDSSNRVYAFVRP
jgi:hypothetical protein